MMVGHVILGDGRGPWVAAAQAKEGRSVRVKARERIARVGRSECRGMIHLRLSMYETLAGRRWIS